MSTAAARRRLRETEIISATRRLFDERGVLVHYHYGEGAYVETELTVQELLGVARAPLEPLRPEDEPDAMIVAPTPDQPSAYSGPYEAGAVWAVLSGSGAVGVDGRQVDVDVELGMGEIEVQHV